MTVDERLQFLLQSTESLQSNAQEVSATVRAISVTVADLKRVVEIDADNIRRLANIAAAHNEGLEDLKARLDRLERRGENN